MGNLTTKTVAKRGKLIIKDVYLGNVRAGASIEKLERAGYLIARIGRDIKILFPENPKFQTTKALYDEFYEQMNRNRV